MLRRPTIYQKLSQYLCSYTSRLRTTLLSSQYSLTLEYFINFSSLNSYTFRSKRFYIFIQLLLNTSLSTLPWFHQLSLRVTPLRGECSSPKTFSSKTFTDQRWSTKLPSSTIHINYQSLYQISSSGVLVGATPTLLVVLCCATHVQRFHHSAPNLS